MKKSAKIFLILSIIFTLIFIPFMTMAIIKSVQFGFNCEAYIKRAADANTIEMAKAELAKAIEYAEENDLTEGIVSIFLKNPKNDLEFWYNNMKAAYEELEELPEDSTPLEKTNVLMKLRESLTDNDSSNGTTVTMPEGISLYPNNVLYFWWGIISGLGMFFSWIIFICLVAENEKKKKEEEDKKKK